MFSVKAVARAINDMLELGGRVTDETREKLDELLGEDFDNFQADADKVLDVIQEKVHNAAQDVLGSLSETITDLKERVNALENDNKTPAKAPAARKDAK